MHRLILILSIVVSAPAFAAWDPSGLALCTLDMSGNQGQVPSALIDDKSDLFLSLDYFSVVATTTRPPKSCGPRTFTKSATNADTSGVACTYAYAYAPGFEFALDFAGDVRGDFIADVVTYFEFESGHNPTFVWSENGQVYRSGAVTHLCRRVVRGKPVPEILVEYLGPDSVEYARIVARSVLP